MTLQIDQLPNKPVQNAVNESSLELVGAVYIKAVFSRERR